MSEEEDKGLNGKKTKAERDAAHSMPDQVVKDEPFFKWLEKLFYAEPESAHYPEKIEVRILLGRNLERFGPQLLQILFAPSKSGLAEQRAGAGRAKPTRSELVALSNELLFRMQKDCDEHGKSHIYGVQVWHFSRGDEPYERWIKRCKPSGRFPRDEEKAGEDEEEETLEKQFSAQVMRHQENMVGLLGGGFEGQLDRQDRIIERLLATLEKKDERIEKMSDQLERALSLEHERKRDLAWTDLKIESVRKGFDLAATWGPPLLNQLVGKQVVPTQKSAESITLETFFRSLTPAQLDAVCGVYGDPPDHTLIKPGILRYEQAKLLIDIAECREPASRLDDVMPGGALEITMQQVAQIGQCGIGMDQLAPLHLIFQARQAKKQQQ